MQVTPVKFTASGIVGTASFTASDNSPLDNKPFTPFEGSSSVTVAQQSEEVVGISFTGFTAVVLHNGSDTTGDVIANCTAPGIYSWNYEINANKGLYLECTGTGTGTVWLV